MTDDGKLTLRQYLLFRALEGMGEQVTMAGYMLAIDAVHTTAMAHPDWDLNARQDWAGWEQWVKDGGGSH